MVLPLFHLDGCAAAKPGDVLMLVGAEGKHAVAVRRIRVGEGIQVSDGRGSRVIGVVTAIDGYSLQLSVSEAILEPSPEPSLVLVQALAKGDRDELAIQAATELGAMAIVPWQAERSVSRWEGPKISKGVDRWQAIVAQASKQALRAFAPSVSQPLTTAQLSQATGAYSRMLVLDPTAERSLGVVDLPDSGAVAIVVGPEGGISPSELSQLEAAGALRVRLGSEILRTSTAGVAAIAVLQSRLSRW